MRSITLISAFLLLFVSVLISPPPISAQERAEPNTLTQKERDNGWTLLFDGETTDGWRGYNKESFPDKGWTVEDGRLIIREAGGEANHTGGDIVTVDTYDDFVLKLEWKVGKGGNSGVFYRALEQQGVPIYWSAPEMQVLDNVHHPDAERGEDGNRKAGSLYDLIPAHPQPFTGHGEWQQVKLVANGSHIEHWLNGEKVLEYELGTPEWYRMIRDSKFECHPEFGDSREGYIGLQDHGTRVEFRNIKIKELSGDSPDT